MINYRHQKPTKMLKLIASGILTISIFLQSHQKCIKTADCSNPSEDPTCSPRLAKGDEQTPKIFKYDEGISVCPNYDGKLSCCNPATMKQLHDNYALIDSLLGDPSVGCGICATNMKRFW